MTKKRMTFWCSQATKEQLTRLARRYGTQATAIAVAIQALDEAETRKEKETK